MNQKRPGIFLEVLSGLTRHLNSVGRKANEVETLHARIVGLVEFCGLKPAEVGAWIEHDTPDKGLLLRMHDLLGSDIGKPRLVSKSKLHGTVHLKAPPKSNTIVKLLSPTGAKTYRLATMLGHLRYIVIYCADHKCRSVEPRDRDEQLAIIAQGMFRNVADVAFEHYAALSASDDPDDAIDLTRARRVFTAKSHDVWRNTNAELKVLTRRMDAHRLEARQLSAAFLLGDRPSLLIGVAASASRAAAEIALSELARSQGPLGLWLRGAVGDLPPFFGPPVT